MARSILLWLVSLAAVVAIIRVAHWLHGILLDLTTVAVLATLGQVAKFHPEETHES